MSSRGVVCATDDGVICFSSLKLLYASLTVSNPGLPLTVVDLGMMYEQRRFVNSLPSVSVMECHSITDVPFRPGRDATRWNKPAYMAISPYSETVWLDTDCIVFRPLDELYALADDGLRVAEDHTPLISPFSRGLLPNKPYVYTRFPVASPLPDGPFCNTGVLSFRLPRDRRFIDKWLAFTRECSRDELLRDSVSWWDQGACQHVLEDVGWRGHLLRDIRWNHPSPLSSGRMSWEGYGGGPCDFVRHLVPGDIRIAHLAGYPKPWGNLADTPLDEIREKIFQSHVPTAARLALPLP